MTQGWLFRHSAANASREVRQVREVSPARARHAPSRTSRTWREASEAPHPSRSDLESVVRASRNISRTAFRVRGAVSAHFRAGNIHRTPLCAESRGSALGAARKAIGKDSAKHPSSYPSPRRRWTRPGDPSGGYRPMRFMMEKTSTRTMMTSPIAVPTGLVRRREGAGMVEWRSQIQTTMEKLYNDWDGKMREDKDPQPVRP